MADGRTTGARLDGIDLARALALLGMIAVHILPTGSETGDPTPVALLQGRAAALFAVLAGVSVVLASRRSLAVAGARGWAGAAAGLVVRGAAIGVIGLALGELGTPIAIVLANYGVLLIIAALLVRLPTAGLAVLAPLWLVATPFLSHTLRASAAVPEFSYLVPALHRAAEADTWWGILLTGYYPVLQWTGYLLVGMLIARVCLGSRRAQAGLLLVGAGFAALAGSASSLLMTWRGRDAVEIAAASAPTWRSPQEILSFGAYGATPTDTWWWLASAGPHSSTPGDMVMTSGIAAAVIGGCLLLCGAVPAWSYSWLTCAGAMPLSMYTLHIVLVFALHDTGIGEQAEFAVNVVACLLAANLIARLISRRGPLEMPISSLSRAASRAVSGSGR